MRLVYRVGEFVWTSSHPEYSYSNFQTGLPMSMDLTRYSG